ncbi:MAG: hypothetical protein BWY79_01720 [Actinobacteria bacterium ADurb.Bin444]|nr:MAG: hypothetical protein BWY79_01720 [Actinobacteria bacterium ADurb.Bin444]
MKPRIPVKYRVYWLIFFCPASPSLASAASEGTTTVSSENMIDAVMYGMIPRANTATRSSAPPTNRSMNAKTPPPVVSSFSAWRSTPGTGM